MTSYKDLEDLVYVKFNFLIYNSSNPRFRIPLSIDPRRPLRASYSFLKRISLAVISFSVSASIVVKLSSLAV